MNQRKIVHYDDSFGDRVEKSQGHGTCVSSILAGKRNCNGQNEDAGHADGTAPRSQLVFFDSYSGIADPGVGRLLKSSRRAAILDRNKASHCTYAALIPFLS